MALEAKLKGAAPLTNRRLSFLIYQGDKLKLDFNHPRATGQISSVRTKLKLKRIWIDVTNCKSFVITMKRNEENVMYPSFSYDP